MASARSRSSSACAGESQRLRSAESTPSSLRPAPHAFKLIGFIGSWGSSVHEVPRSRFGAASARDCEPANPEPHEPHEPLNPPTTGPPVPRGRRVSRGAPASARTCWSAPRRSRWTMPGTRCRPRPPPAATQSARPRNPPRPTSRPTRTGSRIDQDAQPDVGEAGRRRRAPNRRRVHCPTASAVPVKPTSAISSTNRTANGTSSSNGMPTMLMASTMQVRISTGTNISSAMSPMIVALTGLIADPLRRAFDERRASNHRHRREQEQQQQPEGRADEARHGAETVEQRQQPEAADEGTDAGSATRGSANDTSVTAAAHLRARRTADAPADADDVAADDRLRAERDRPEHRHDLIADFAVDPDRPQHRHHLAGDLLRPPGRSRRRKCAPDRRCERTSRLSPRRACGGSGGSAGAGGSVRRRPEAQTAPGAPRVPDTTASGSRRHRRRSARAARGRSRPCRSPRSRPTPRSAARRRWPPWAAAPTAVGQRHDVVARLDLPLEVTVLRTQLLRAGHGGHHQHQHQRRISVSHFSHSLPDPSRRCSATSAATATAWQHHHRECHPRIGDERRRRAAEAGQRPTTAPLRTSGPLANHDHDRHQQVEAGRPRPLASSDTIVPAPRYTSTAAAGSPTQSSPARTRRARRASAADAAATAAIVRALKLAGRQRRRDGTLRTPPRTRRRPRRRRPPLSASRQRR